MRYFFLLPSGQRSLCPAKPIKAFIVLCLVVMQPAKNTAGSLPARSPDFAKHKKCFMLPFALILMRFFFRYMPPLFILSPRHPSYSPLPAKNRQAMNHSPVRPQGAPQKKPPPQNKHGEKCRSIARREKLPPSTYTTYIPAKPWISVAPRCSATPIHTKTRCRIEI